MSFSIGLSTIQCYHSRTDLIWPDVPFIVSSYCIRKHHEYLSSDNADDDKSRHFKHWRLILKLSGSHIYSITIPLSVTKSSFYVLDSLHETCLSLSSKVFREQLFFFICLSVLSSFMSFYKIIRSGPWKLNSYQKEWPDVFHKKSRHSSVPQKNSESEERCQRKKRWLLKPQSIGQKITWFCPFIGASIRFFLQTYCDVVWGMAMPLPFNEVSFYLLFHSNLRKTSIGGR
jgi:hypothetical protein